MNQYKLLPFLLFLLASCTQISSSVSIVPIWDEMIVILAPHGFEVFFDSGTTHTARDIYTPGSTVINWSYFWVTDSGVYYPAGLWIEKWKQSYSLEQSDPNLSHVVLYRPYGDSLTIVANSETSEQIPMCIQNPAGCTAFQAGPLVLSGGIIQDFGKSWHANESHERTLMGKTQSGKVYFFISRQQLSLTEVGEQIARDPRFQQDPITVLNLDGWPSTAYYDGIHGFREDKKLPIFIRINP
jgi:Phosphodiester glycosidase